MALPFNVVHASGLFAGLVALPASIAVWSLALSSMASSTKAQAERAAPARVIKCEGPFGREASHAGLVKAFGNSNVVYQDIDGAEGETIKASVLYPKDPKAKLEFIWSDADTRRRPMIRAKDQSTWATANGIRIGMSLADVEKLNGKPFKLSGFDWDYGGRVTDWQDGALAKPQPGGCIIGMDFVHPEDAPDANLTKVTGDSEFLSDNADMRAVEPYVASLTVSYPQR
jgi:hypothetical protein